ncbi:MAG TPA: hydrogenase expression/formation protein HypE [candidate division Zixibacteria bacterium]|nr:hydrogenase expression/formation protein HypE [candidate division Zixibacteria bacterium]
MKNGQSKIRLIDGEGGRATSRLIRDLFLKHFDNPLLSKLNDSAVANIKSSRIAFTTDGFVIDPLEFPGGNIGKLAICGTVNDLAASGSKPIMLSASFILEEGFEISILERIVEKMAQTATEADVAIVCGDTKVVQKGKGDGIYITTSGVGILPENVSIDPENIREGDVIIVSGPIAQHASAIIALRENLKTNPPLESDCAPLSAMVQLAIETVSEIRAMRDPTRGGLGGILLELASQSGTKFILDEKSIPVENVVRNICELFGYDPLFMACEGRMAFVVSERMASRLLKIISNDPYGHGANIIGRVEKGEGVILETKSGGRRKLAQPEGSPLPRIC